MGAARGGCACAILQVHTHAEMWEGSESAEIWEGSESAIMGSESAEIWEGSESAEIWEGSESAGDARRRRRRRRLCIESRFVMEKGRERQLECMLVVLGAIDQTSRELDHRA